jgi:predicted regulator of Ras-like GTPase activity (Roadblock/LC7/MglB family)
MDAAQALADLTEISSQIQAAVLLDAGGGVISSTVDDDARTQQVAEGARALLAAAEESGPSAPLVQLEAATPDGSVFVLRGEKLVVAATTTPEPTVGLVFYDLKSCLRAAEAPEGDAKPRPRARQKAAVEKESGGEA